MAKLQIAQDEAADELLSTDPFALLTGMLLDQQFPMERAFAGPAKIRDRFGNIDPAEIADADPDAFADLCATPPAVHRYGRSMAGRIQAVAEVVRDLWRRDKDRGLSAGEKRMLSKARQILVSELALAEGTNEDKAEILLDEVLAS